MPPQAYTKETLQEAFEWWSEQPDELRAKIQDKDDLVGYYLRIHRGVEESPQKEGGFTKAAKESFSTELKGLVKNLDAFEGYEGRDKKDISAQAAAAVQAQPQQQPQQTFARPVYQQPRPQTVELSSPQHVFEPASQLQFPEMSKPLVPEKTELPQAVKTNALTTQGGQGQFFRLDATSKVSVAQAKKLLNLSSDEEALRALIALGGAKIKGLI